jgi:hypothetical protein
MRLKTLLLATTILLYQFINAQQVSILKKHFSKTNSNPTLQSKKFSKASMVSVPQLTLRYTWEDENYWQIIPDSIINTYNADGTISSELTLSNFNGTFSYKNYITYVYNSKGKLVSEYGFQENVERNDWDTVNMAIYTYNNNGNQTSYESSSKIGNKWQFDYGYKSSFVYSGNNVTEEISQSWNEDTEVYENESKNIYTYNSQGIIIEALSMVWDADVSRFINGYEIINIVWYKWDGFYSDNTLIKSYDEYEWDGDTYIASQKEEVDYDSHDNEIEYKTSLWNGSEWVVDYWQKIALTYNNNDAITEMISQNQGDTAFENELKEVYSNFFVYNSIHNIIKDNAYVNIYPNPIKTSFTIETDLSTTDNTQFNMYDMLGRNVLKQPITSPKTLVEKVVSEVVYIPTRLSETIKLFQMEN